MQFDAPVRRVGRTIRMMFTGAMFLFGALYAALMAITGTWVSMLVGTGICGVALVTATKLRRQGGTVSALPASLDRGS